MINQDFIDKALAAHRAVWSEYDGLRYVRFVDDFQGICRGTVVFGDQVVYGYPSIGRVLALNSGLRGQFHAPFWMEEKVDGFNVRLIKLNHRLLALTRGGFICPFTTDRIVDLLNPHVFEHEPDIVLCGEVVGPDNPYMEGSVPYIKQDVELFVFDIGAINQKRFMGYADKESLIERYQLPSVQRFGRFQINDLPKIGEILLQLNIEYREGVIFKEDSPRDHRAKYTTSNINIVDIEAGAYTMFDLPPEYFKNRIARLVLFMDEQGLSSTVELQQQLGEAYVRGLLEAIQQVHEHHKVFRTFRCRFRQRENAVKLLKHLSEIGGHVQITLRELKEQDGYWLLEFDKVFPKSSGTLSSLLKGSLLFD
ncbi:MAG: ATP-dependent DNA ligase [Gammaproteobacteria bacterium SG8_11]|nr:MAG: ATP-dependent DNA ligase [Gammaproteobacteria bacterium SG8_11]